MASSYGLILPNGIQLTSNALTKDGMNAVLISLSALIFNFQIDSTQPNYDPVNSQLLRLTFPTDGQPDWGTVQTDVTFVSAMPEDDTFNRIRDKVGTAIPGAAPLVNQTYTYNRVWRAKWTLYGPNSFDRARLILSAFFMDFAEYLLQQNNLSLVTSINAPVRAPEFIAAQWWERVDVWVKMNEFVTENLTDPTIGTIGFNLNIQQ